MSKKLGGKNGDIDFRQSELDAYDRRIENSKLTQTLIQKGATILKDNVVPPNQIAQLYRTQERLHNGSDDKFWTTLGNVVTKNPEKRLQLLKESKDAIKFAPKTIAEHWKGEYEKILIPRGNMIAEDFAKKLIPYAQSDQYRTTWNPTVRDPLLQAMVKVLNHMADSMSKAQTTTVSDVDIWMSQLKSGTNSGDPLYQSLDKEQWKAKYIPLLMPYIREIASGGELNRGKDQWTRGDYTMFGRTPDRPVHAVSTLNKLAGAKLNYDLTAALGDGKYPHMAWFSLEKMFNRASVGMANVETTLHEDFKAFDTTVSPQLLQLVLTAFDESRFLSNSTENRNIMRHLITDLSNGTLLRIGPFHKMEMRPGLYSGTPITQWIGSLIHASFIEMQIEEYSAPITDYMVLSDDGFCMWDDTKANCEIYLEQTLVPSAIDIGMVISPAKSYIADITQAKAMLSRSGEDPIIRHDVGPFLQKYPQLDPDHSFGNVPRLTRSLLGRERRIDRTTQVRLFENCKPLLKSDAGTGKALPAWVSDFWRTMEVLSQVRPGYPRIRQLVSTVMNIYPKSWDRLDLFVDSVETTGGDLFDIATRREGGPSDKGTSRWLIDYLKDAERNGRKFSKLPLD